MTNPVIDGGTLYPTPGDSVIGSIGFGANGGTLYDASNLPDTVVGFAEGDDHLSFTGENPATEDAVLASAVTANGNTLLTFPDQTSFLLVGVAHVDTGIFA